jgi:CRP/FNR family transcriptional regulator, cyclic AMP receptor protein
VARINRQYLYLTIYMLFYNNLYANLFNVSEPRTSDIPSADNAREIVIRIVVEHANQPGVSVSSAPHSSFAAGLVGLSPSGLSSLPSRSRQYKRGQVIFQVKEKADSLMIVDSGVVRTFLEVPGKELAARLVREGEIIGETALVSDVRDHSAVVMEDASLREYDVPVVTAALANDSVGIEITRLLVSRIHDLYVALTEQAILPSLSRLAKTIIELAQQDGEPVEGGVLIKSRPTHDVLASMISARRETVTLHMQALRSKGAVELRDSGLLVRLELLRKFTV